MIRHGAGGYGVDIGCGMIAVRTQFNGDDITRRGHLAALREAIEDAIPLSAGFYSTSISRAHTTARIEELERLEGADSADKAASNWRLQLGSLGSGNHFIEVSLDEAGRAWLFLHSGSRGVGNRLATGHIKIARALATKWWIPLPDPDLGTRSYVVSGKGSRLSLNSSPHGADRQYSRSAARRRFTRDQLDAAMAGIEWAAPTCSLTRSRARTRTSTWS